MLTGKRRILFGVVLAASLGISAQAQFATRSIFSLFDNDPYSLVAGDFNGDGILDVAVSNSYTTSLNIYLGNGDGTFRAGATYSVPYGFYAVTASLRNNGILDIVVGAAGFSDAVFVMLGNGDGTFQPAVEYAATAESRMIALGDFNGDGKIDIVNLEWDNILGIVCNCVEVFLGNGDGTFAPPITTPIPHNTGGVSIATGDFNNDGKLDVVVGGDDYNEVVILLGNGNGTFDAGAYYTVETTPVSITTGHFTGDKTKTDLAMGIELAVMLGNGDGTFQPPSYYQTSGVDWVVAQDLDGDGKIDLASSGDGVTVLRGNGDGTFGHREFYPAGTNKRFHSNYYIAAGDFNNDGMPDLVVTEFYGSEIVTLLNTGSVRFQPPSPLTFEKQLLGTTSAPMSVSLTNYGSTPIRLSSVESSGAPFHMQGTTCLGSLAPGAQCTITVDFTPTAKGMVSGGITINDSASSKPQFVELIGSGSELGISPTHLMFPPQEVGTESVPRTTHLTNVGKTSVGFSRPIAIFGGNAASDFQQSNDCGTHLQPGASCTITIVFGPQKTGKRNASVYLEDDGGDSPQKIELSGTGD